MFHEEERPRNVWIEQLALAEIVTQVADSPKLMPDNLQDRVDMLGSLRSHFGRRWHWFGISEY